MESLPTPDQDPKQEGVMDLIRELAKSSRLTWRPEERRVVKIRRSSGGLDTDWEVIARNERGEYAVCNFDGDKPDGYKILTQGDLLIDNPGLFGKVGGDGALEKKFEVEQKDKEGVVSIESLVPQEEIDRLVSEDVDRGAAVFLERFPKIVQLMSDPETKAEQKQMLTEFLAAGQEDFGRKIAVRLKEVMMSGRKEEAINFMSNQMVKWRKEVVYGMDKVIMDKQIEKAFAPGGYLDQMKPAFIKETIDELGETIIRLNNATFAVGGEGPLSFREQKVGVVSTVAELESKIMTRFTEDLQKDKFLLELFTALGEEKFIQRMASLLKEVYEAVGQKAHEERAKNN